MSTLKGASPLKGDEMRTFKRVQATFKLFNYKVAHSILDSNLKSNRNGAVLSHSETTVTLHNRVKIFSGRC